jgi:fructosamine-3-kinase
MKNNNENMSQNIHFKNQPKLSGFDIDKSADELRVNLIPHIKEFLETEDLFKDKEVTIEFSHEGVSSLVSFVEVGEEKYVLKIPLFNSSYAGSEALFLKAWNGVEVPVPHVYKEGVIGGRRYVLMQYIDAPILLDVIEKGEAREDISIDLGKTLAKMHTAKAEGYGRVVDGKPQYETFKAWIMNEDIQKRIAYVKEHNLLTDEHGKIEKVIDVLIEYAEGKDFSTYCHFDFGASNILATEPPTVIDPDPMMNNGIIDIGRSILLASSGGHDGEQLKQGYFSDTEYNAQALQAAIILNAHWKFAYWHKKNKTNQIEHVQKYLAQTAHLLK